MRYILSICSIFFFATCIMIVYHDNKILERRIVELQIRYDLIRNDSIDKSKLDSTKNAQLDSLRASMQLSINHKKLRQK